MGGGEVGWWGCWGVMVCSGSEEECIVLYNTCGMGEGEEAEGGDF